MSNCAVSRRRVLLRAQKFGYVFEDEDVTEMLAAGMLEARMLAIGGHTAFENSDGGGEMEDARAGLHLHLRRG